MRYKELKEYYIDVLRRISKFEKRESSPIILLSKKARKSTFYIFFLSFLDFLELTLKLIIIRFNKKPYSLIYTHANLCAFENNQFKERLVDNLKIENRIYINQGKEKIIKLIDGYKTYNIGGVVDLVSRLFLNKNNKINSLKAYYIVNNYILFFYSKKNIYLLCHYDQNGLSIVFSKYRKKIKLIEVQHGGMINYPPYMNPSLIKIADIFYIRNNKTIDYLKKHLNSHFKNIEYHIIPYAKPNLIEKEGIHILYASTVEINGFHPVFLEFLKCIELPNLNLIIRLHPRERHKQEIFERELTNKKINYRFDNSKNWLESNTIKNLIVISPASSVIEESVDYEFTTIIIDRLGKDRFNYLIDEKKVFYADTIKKITQIINI